jgi:hypothetical protein
MRKSSKKINVKKYWNGKSVLKGKTAVALKSDLTKHS